MDKINEYSPFIKIPLQSSNETVETPIENIIEVFNPFQNNEYEMLFRDVYREYETDENGFEPETGFIQDSKSGIYQTSFSNEFDISPDNGITDYLDVSAVNSRLLKTGIFIPSGFQKTDKINIVLYLHGLFKEGDRINGIEYYWKNYSNIRECFYRSRRNGILIAPTLSSNPQNDNIIFNNTGGLDKFLSGCLKALQHKHYIPASSDFSAIIIAGHSAGGKPLSRIVSSKGIYNGKITECWGFDCLYAESWASGINGWAKGNKKFYHYWAWSCSAKNLNSCPRVIGDKILGNPNIQNIAPEGKISHQQIIENAWLKNINSRSWFKNITGGEVPPQAKQNPLFDTAKAVRLNSYYSRSLGWEKYYDKINDLLLPFSGMKNVSLGEEAFAGAVYAWQRHHGISEKDCDGIIGPETWEKMKVYILKDKAGTQIPVPAEGLPVSGGLVFSKYSLSTKEIIVQKKDDRNKYSEIKESPMVFLKEIVRNAGEDPDGWFDRFTRITFLGRSLKKDQYIQENFAIHLKTLEKKFAAQFGGPGADPSAAGDNLKLTHEGIAGSRLVSSTATYSYHMFGLAADINYSGCPYIQAHESFNKFMGKVSKLVANIETKGIAWGLSIPALPQKYLDLYDELLELNNYLKKYFSFLEPQNESQLNLSLSQCSYQEWKGISSSRAKEIIGKDLREISKAWKGSRTNPENIFKDGFLNLSRDFVKGMVESGMDWGARYGDIMHFDMRSVPGIGSKIEKAKNNYIRNIKDKARQLYVAGNREYLLNEDDSIYSDYQETSETYEFEDNLNSTEEPLHELQQETLISPENFVPDLSKAVRLNLFYSDKLGWNQFHDQINNLMLPFSGQQNISLGEEAFAEAVAEWQKQQGFPEKDCDGIIGLRTWNIMKPIINSDADKIKPYISDNSVVPSKDNIPEFNQWYAQKILEAVNSGIAGFNSHLKIPPGNQIETIAKGDTVLNVDPDKNIIQILPVIYHILEKAREKNYKDILIGSFIREADQPGCTGHCDGRCIDLNFRGGSFEKPDSTRMVIKILEYLTTLPPEFKKNLGFGMPLQGDFFGHHNFKKFKSVDSSNLLNPELRKLIVKLGIVFPDNNDHLHIQVRWLPKKKYTHDEFSLGLLDENGADQFKQHENIINNLFENYSLSYKLEKVGDWLPLLLFKVDDALVAELKSRNMYVQYAHNESYSNDLNTDFYRLRIHKYPLLNGIQMNAESLIKYIRLNINSLIDTDYCDFSPYDASIDAPVWESDNPKGAVLKLDIKGPDNASVVVSLSKPNGWRFTTVHTPATGAHPVSGNREFFIGKDSKTGGTYFIIKGLDMMSSGVAGLGLPWFGSWGFGQGDALWKSMRTKVIQLINTNGGEASEDITYSERVEWRFVYYSYKNSLEDVFGKGAGSTANSPFFDISEVPAQSFI
ncbi:MAG: hypothetical protein WBV81_13175 [Ignavibacteriaceae bacterium]